MDKTRHLLKESAVSAAINALISAAFFFGFFSINAQIPVWGLQGYAFDFVPQSFAVSLMSAFMPGLLTRKRLKESPVGGGRLPSVRGVFVAALLWAVAGLVVGAGLAALVLKLSGIGVVAGTPALFIKVVYGAFLGAIVTYWFVGRLVRNAA